MASDGVGVVVEVDVVDVEGAVVVATVDSVVSVAGAALVSVEVLPSATGSSDPPSIATSPHAAPPTISTSARATPIRRTTYRRWETEPATAAQAYGRAHHDAVGAAPPHPSPSDSLALVRPAGSLRSPGRSGKHAAVDDEHGAGHPT